MNYNQKKVENTSYCVFIAHDDPDPELTAARMRLAREELVNTLLDALWSNHWYAVRITQRVGEHFSFDGEPAQAIRFKLEFGEVVEEEYFPARTDPARPGFFRRVFRLYKDALS